MLYSTNGYASPFRYCLTTSGILPEDAYLAHYQVKGAKWGTRRYQYENGSLTPLGRIHYGVGAARLQKHVKNDGTLTNSGREEYHRQIAKKVTKDKLQQQRAAMNPAENASLGNKWRNRNRNKIQKEIQEEFNETPEGQRLQKANKDLSKIQGRMNYREGSYEDQNALGKIVNSIGQDADRNRMAAALAEQNEAQKAAAKTYEEIREKYKNDLLEATMKDLKIWNIDDGKEFLEKYMRGDEDATFGKRDKKQEREDLRELKEERKEKALEEQRETFKKLYGDDYDKGEDPEYLAKIKGKGNKEDRYIYDKDELKAYKESISGEDLEKDGYKKSKSGPYEKDLENLNANTKSASISADKDNYFKEPLSNKEYKALLKDIEKNYDTIQKNLGKAMIDKLAENDEYKYWKSYDGSKSLEEQKKIFLKNLGTQFYKGSNHPGYSYIRVMGDGYGEFEIDDGGEYGGHWLSTEIDWTKGWDKPEVKWVSING